jgi:hypothetical protein
MNNPVSANGVTGHLIYVHGADKYQFRVYDSEHNFVDYDLMHSDLTVTINDEDAFFYRSDNIDRLDHSPATLGIKE